MIGPYTITATDIHGAMTIASRIFPIAGSLSNVENHYSMTVTLHSGLPDDRGDILSPRILGLTAANAAVDIAGAGLQGNGTAYVPFRQPGHSGDMTTVTQLEVTFVGATGDWWSGTITYSINVDAAYCQYGTRTNPDAVVYTFVTGALVDAIAALLGLGVLGIMALDTMLGAPLSFPTCDHSPPLVPDFTPDDFILGTVLPSPSGIAKAGQLFARGVWLFYCMCVPAPPGLPDPITYPGGVDPTSPIAGGSQPAFTCDSSDVCVQLNQIVRQLNAINYQINSLRQDVTIVQRQSAPFAYVYGATHAGLSGSGQFAVSDILGLIVRYSTIPSYLGRNDADPPTYYNLGRIALGTVDGWRQSHFAQHNPWQLLPIDGAVTLVGYTFADGAVADIVELLREP